MSTQFHNLKVMKVTPEISDASSITFEIPSDLEDKFDYTHGQYLTLKFQINGKEERRAYSMSSSPLENGITVTQKSRQRNCIESHLQ